MLDVAISLLPACIFGVFNFGWYALLLILVSVATCVLLEFLWDVLTRKKMTIRDMSAVVTGMILALNLPPKLPLWMAAVGAAFAIIIVKLLFGGLGQNFMNPALAGRCMEDDVRCLEHTAGFQRNIPDDFVCPLCGAGKDEFSDAG